MNYDTRVFLSAVLVEASWIGLVILAAVGVVWPIVAAFTFRGTMRITELFYERQEKLRKLAARRELHEALAASREVVMTPAEREAQARSFTYGNLKIDNDALTLEDFDRMVPRRDRGEDS